MKVPSISIQKKINQLRCPPTYRTNLGGWRTSRSRTYRFRTLRSRTYRPLDVQVFRHPGLSDIQVPGRPSPRTSRPFGLPGLSDIQVPGHPSPRTTRPFGLPGLRTSRSFGRPLIVGSIYPIQIYKIQVKYISQIVCSLSNRKLTFIPQMLA